MSTDLIRIQPGAGVPMIANANDLNDMFSAGGDGPRLPKLSIRGGVFRYKKGGVEQNLNTRVMNVVLVGARKPLQRAYFAKQYSAGDDGGVTMPDCASDNGVAPNPGVAHPQAGTCAACPQNVWGSKTSAAGKPIRACGESKYLVVTPATDNPDEAAVLQLPATSIKGFKQYMMALNNAGLPANAVVTEISFGDTEYPSINFACVNYLTEAQRIKVSALAATDDVVEAITVKEPQPLPVLTPAPTPLEAPPAAPIIPAVAPAPATAVTGFGAPSPSQTPIVQPVAAAPVATPVVVSEVLPPEAPATVADAGTSDDLQNILNNWASK